MRFTSQSRSLRRSAVVLLAAFIWVVGVKTSAAQFVGVQYGPRAFSTAPKGTHALSLTLDGMDMGIGVDGTLLSSISNRSNSVYLSYSYFFSLGGKAASVTFALPYVDIASTVNTTCCGSFPGLEESGITDPFLQFNVALIGGKALPLREFFQTEPGFVMSLHTGIRVPIGEYNPDSPLNVGGNRFEYRVGLPLSYIWGTPSKQTSVELDPTVYFFADNNDPYGSFNVSQDPVLQIEAHVTHDFLPALWGALNAQWVQGGETTTDSVLGDNAIDYAGIGGSVGGRLSKSLGCTVTYATRLYSKNTLNSGGLWRVGLTYTFLPQ